MATTVSFARRKLNVGDKVHYKNFPNDNGVIINIDKEQYPSAGGYVTIERLDYKDQPISVISHWLYKNCILVKEKKETQDSNLCSCPIEILMGKGCSCGGS